MNAVLISIIIVCIIASLVGTLWVATKPGEKKYDAKSKANVKRLTVIYGITTILSVLIFVLYLYRT
ncbi:hypothetical protein [Ammoniphilus sp. YIM 78166]|uniref:hypothetical protein n=1 Tax=Ammoniphilus sp. YIM 78166 TaxID=1644106 RepID=UPI00107025BA|nr:hypothetical protein [Ammoniphilus sp. YIM 78166]